VADVSVGAQQARFVYVAINLGPDRLLCCHRKFRLPPSVEPQLSDHQFFQGTQSVLSVIDRLELATT
jgi:hypothetical protein